PHQEPTDAADLIRRLGPNPGIAAVAMMLGVVEPPFGDTFYNPIYEAAQDVGLPIVFHGAGVGLNNFVMRGFQRFIEVQAVGYPFYSEVTATSVVIQGLAERFPGLKMLFL